MMEKGFPSKKKNVPTIQKEVFKELDNRPLGRDSPESGINQSEQRILSQPMTKLTNQNHCRISVQ